jgi:hypothetical protein
LKPATGISKSQAVADPQHGTSQNSTDFQIDLWTCRLVPAMSDSRKRPGFS